MGMSPSLTPDHLRGVWPDFDWDNRQIRAVEAPVSEMPVAELRWLLDVPIWSSRPPEPLFDLRPREVLDHPERHPRHAQRIREADLEHPLQLLDYKGRWVVLDGLHRLVRLVSEDAETARVRCLSQAAIAQIRRGPRGS